MDPVVYNSVAPSMVPFDPEWRRGQPYEPNGSDPSSHEGVKSTFAQKKHHKKDIFQHPYIADRNMDPKVYEAVAGSMVPFDPEWRAPSPYAHNG